MKKEIKKNLIIFSVMNLALISFAVLYTVYFEITKDTPHEIVCVFKDKFGFYCPGCGGSRSLSAFLHFDLLTSFVYYPAIPVSALVILSYDVRLILTVVKKDTKYTDTYRFYPFILIPITIILTFLIRNILLFGFGIDILGDIIR